MDHELIRATPAGVGAAVTWLAVDPINLVVGVLTSIYICVLIGFKIWQWRREAKK